MSLPIQGSIKVRVAITAAQAARLAWDINHLLSRVQDLQKAAPEFWTSTKSDDQAFWQGALRGISISENVALEILPDRRTPGTSGYLNYAGPHPDQYVEQDKGLWLEQLLAARDVSTEKPE